MTAEELFALPADGRIDRRLIRGRLVERPYPFRGPAHAGAVANLATLFGNWERSAAGAGRTVYGYGCPYRLRRDPDTVLYYDASVIPDPLDVGSTVRVQFIDGRPALAAEVIDLSDPMDAVVELIDVTVTSGVPKVWLVDPFQKLVTVCRPGEQPALFTDTEELSGDAELPGFRCRVAEIFE